MGREIRRVPVEFNHPIRWREQRQRRITGEMEDRWTYCLAPMWDYSLSEAQRRWDEEAAECATDGTLDKVWTQDDLDRWRSDRPTRLDDIAEIERDLGKPIWASVEDYCGKRPSDADGEDYQPEDWPPEHERGWVVYETVSEGTPITPCFATAAELIDWLAEKGTAWDGPMSREGAARFVESGWVPSMIVGGGVVRAGLDIAETAA
jgi:hypothetical protein